MPGPTKQRINVIINDQKKQTSQVHTYTPENTPPPQTPPPPVNPPTVNPLESIMSMMAPMMSSMIIGGNDEPDVDVTSEISEHVSDAEISKELQELEASNLELDESDNDQSGNDQSDNDQSGNDQSDNEQSDKTSN